jgi:hypothetical protein
MKVTHLLNFIKKNIKHMHSLVNRQVAISNIDVGTIIISVKCLPKCRFSLHFL